MNKIIRTQINRNGTVSVWNTMQDTKQHKQYYIIQNPKGVTESHLNMLNDLREFNKLSESAKLIAKDKTITQHEPGVKGKCLAI